MEPAELDPTTVADDPIEQFRIWFDEATAAGVRQPDAMTVATVGADGHPGARTVLVRGVDARGFAFYTNLESAKADDLRAHARAALVFHWREQERQVRVVGPVTRIDRAEVARYWATRPRAHQLGAWASPQSRVVADRGDLDAALADIERRFPGAVPAPPHWAGSGWASTSSSCGRGAPPGCTTACGTGAPAEAGSGSGSPPESCPARAPRGMLAAIDTSWDPLGARVASALRAACHPRGGRHTSVGVMGATGLLLAVGDVAAAGGVAVSATTLDVDALVVRLFREHASSLVRLARLFVDDRNAAEDLVQEAFIRLSRSAHRIEDPDRSAAYLRSIVLNLARDQNRRGLVSLRHHLPFDDDQASLEDEIVLREDQQRVIDALRTLPHRQRDCVVLRYYFELGIAEIAETLGVSPNSVKTHLRRGMAALEARLGDSDGAPSEPGEAAR